MILLQNHHTREAHEHHMASGCADPCQVFKENKQAGRRIMRLSASRSIRSEKRRQKEASASPRHEARKPSEETVSVDTGLAFCFFLSSLLA